MVAERASASEVEAGKIEDLHAATYAAKTRVISHKIASSKKWLESLRIGKKPQIQKRHQRMFTKIPPKSKSPLYSSLRLHFSLLDQ